MTIEAARKLRQHSLEPRCGKWSLLAALPGVKIAAHDDPEHLELFAPPRSFLLVTSDATGRRVTPRMVDPEEPQPSRLEKLVTAVTGRHDIVEEVLDGTD